jgi:hypothetical protein
MLSSEKADSLWNVIKMVCCKFLSEFTIFIKERLLLPYVIDTPEDWDERLTVCRHWTGGVENMCREHRGFCQLINLCLNTFSVRSVNHIVKWEVPVVRWEGKERQGGRGESL